MASELQSLACATFAVAADMTFSAFNIGVEFITVPSKQELFYIYLVNLLVIIVAQAIAQYEIKSKVLVCVTFCVLYCIVVYCIVLYCIVLYSLIVMQL